MNENKTFTFQDDADEENISLAANLVSSNSEVCHEEVFRRDAYTKHFQMKDGSHIAVAYAKPIHAVDPNAGKYIDLAQDFEDHEDGYVKNTTRFRVFFPKDNREKFTTVTKGNLSVAWKFLTDVFYTHPVIQKQSDEQNTPYRILEVPKLRYDSQQNSMEYAVADGGIKETLMLSQRPNQTSFHFALKLSGLTPVLSSDKSIVYLFSAEEKSDSPAFTIPPVHMVDQTGMQCDNAHYELCESDDGWLLTIVADPEWLLAENRLYPVLIDPQLLDDATTSGHSSVVSICSNGAKAIDGLTQSVGCFADHTENRVLMKFNSVNIPANAKLVSATLSLKGTGSSGETSFGVYQILSDWTPSSVSWGNQPSYSSSALDIFSSNGGNTLKMDITSAAKDWIHSTSKNYGLLFKIVCPICSGGDDCLKSRYQGFYTDTEYFPYITFRYILVDEYADNQMYKNFELGRAESGAVNLFTGKLAFAHQDVSASGGKFPLNISHLYRSDYAEVGDTDKTFGTGWRLSIAQTLVKATGDYIAVYTDAKGRRHYFGKTKYTNDGKTVYYDTAGMGLEYDGGNTITDEKDNTMVFEGGRLTKISDANKNTMEVSYDSSGRPKGATDSIGRTATMSYSNGKLSTITDQKGRTISFTYSGSLLSKITYPDGLSSVFKYNNNLLYTVEDPSGICSEIAYQNISKDACVSSVYQKGGETVSNNSSSSGNRETIGGFTIDYRAISTSVKDIKTKIALVYFFDSNGRVTSSYEDLRDNTKLAKGEITFTDISEYAIMKNRAGYETSGKYATASASISGDAKLHPNWLTNGTFNKSSAGTVSPSSWNVYGAYDKYDGVVEESYLPEHNSYKFDTSCCGCVKKLERTLSLCNCIFHGNMFVFSAWAKASNPLNTVSDEANAKFELRATLSFENGQSIVRTAKFDCACTDWQYVAIPLEHETISMSPSTVKLTFDFSGNNGTCLVSNCRLTETKATYQRILTIADPEELHDDKSYARRVIQHDDKRYTWTFYNKNYDAVRMTEYIYDDPTNPNVFQTKIEYDGKHQPTKITDYRNITTQMTYDAFGNVTNKDRYGGTDTLHRLREKKGYDSKTGLLTHEYDERDLSSATRYEHDTKSGAVTRQIDKNGQIYDYTYNSKNDLLTGVTAQDAICSCCDVTNEYSYNKDYLTRVWHNGFAYDFEYGKQGRLSTVSVAGKTIVSNTYTIGEDETVTSVYGNGYKTAVTYDSRGNPKEKKIDGVSVLQTTYDGQGRPIKLLDKRKGSCYTYAYDWDGRLDSVYEQRTSDNSQINQLSYTYDEVDRLLHRKESCTDFDYTMLYESDSYGRIYPDDVLCGVTLSGKYTDKLTRDKLNRPSVRTLTLRNNKDLFRVNYLYSGTSEVLQTNYVGILRYEIGNNVKTESYTYDSVGNIRTYTGAGKKAVTYTYDGIGQLTEEFDRENCRDTLLTYDAGGNIKSKKVYRLNSSGNVVGNAIENHTYTYDASWKDKLIAFDGKSITYDAIGNPVSYRGNRLVWKDVRRLVGYGSNTFAYDAGGNRIKKNGTTYTLDGARILRETGGCKDLTYYYGFNNDVIGFRCDCVDYYYRKNLQGDVIDIYDAAGNCVVTYAYDAWGKLLSVSGSLATSIGYYNPFRYRSYYYDVETGLYYLNSRYYDPEVGRWINADDIAYLGVDGPLSSFNLFAYCGNNPVTGYDPNGTWDWGNFFKGSGWIATGIAAVVVGVSILTCGVAAPAMIAVAAVTVTTGVATTVNGVSEIGEAATGHNFMRDDVFQGNTTAYNVYSYSTAAVAQVGTAICGGWMAKNAPKIEAYNNIENYQYTKTIAKADHMSRPYANSVLTQKEVIKYGTMTKDSFGYVFSTMGSVNGGDEKLWRLGVNVAEELVWHWGHGF